MSEDINAVGIISHRGGYTGDPIPGLGKYPSVSRSQSRFSRRREFLVIDTMDDIVHARVIITLLAEDAHKPTPKASRRPRFNPMSVTGPKQKTPRRLLPVKVQTCTGGLLCHPWVVGAKTAFSALLPRGYGCNAEKADMAHSSQ